MALRNLLLAMIVLAGILVAGQESARAQNDPSQRMLPLPQRDLPDFQQQMELLKRLRSLIESRQQQPSPTPDAADSKPPADPQQFEQLRSALKNLQEKMPPGFVPPDLSSIPPEQIRQALENPAVQQQMRDMLKQFSKDGILPPPGAGDGTSPPLPLPPTPPANDPVRPGDRNRQRPNDLPKRKPSEDDPRNSKDETPSPLPPSPLPPSSMKSLQDFLKKFSENPVPNDTPQNPAVSQPSPPRPLRKKEFRTPPNPPRTTDEPRVVPSPLPPGTDTPAPDPQLQTNPLSRSQQSAPQQEPANPERVRPPNNNVRNTSPAGESLRDPSVPTPNMENVDADARQQTLKALQDLMNEMTEQMRRESESTQQPDLSPKPGVVPPKNRVAQTPQTMPPNGGNSNRAGNPNSASEMPSVPEFLKEQLKRLQLSPQDSSTGPGSPLDRSAVVPPQMVPRSNPPARPNQRMPRAPVAQSPTPGMNAPAERTVPPMDIQKELARNGFGGTLKKIVEKAKQESRQPRSSDHHPTTPGGTASAAPNSGHGLEKSMIRMLDGMKDDLAEIAKEGRFKEPSRRSDQRRQSSPRPDSGPQSESVLEKMRKATSELFAGPPNPPQKNSRPGGTASSLTTPSLETQFDLTPVAVLAGLLAAVAAGFFGLRFLNHRMAAAAAGDATVAPIAPAEIQNRADVIRAFHEFALRSTKSVQSWWTHRAVERVIVTAAPERKAAVETLANAYEQARYLPQELEFSSEQIQSARNALQQCAPGAPV